MGRFILSLGFCLLLQGAFVFTEKVVIDLQSAAQSSLIDVTCLYTEDYNDFWVFGYPIQIAPENDKYPEFQGFWTPGQAQRCEIHYYGGRDMPPPKSVTVSFYQENSPQIVLSGKSSLDTTADFIEVGSLTSSEKFWTTATLDLTEHADLSVFNFTLISMGTDIMLLDTIVLDLGEDTTRPTEEPHTTHNPIEGYTVLLDTKEDLLPSLWEDTCGYTDEQQYFWAYGCPFEPQPETNTLGFWGPCNKNCTLRMKVHEFHPMTPESQIILWYYQEFGSRMDINFYGPPKGKDGVPQKIKHTKITTSLEDGGWVKDVFRWNGTSNLHVVELELISDGNAQVVIDNITLFLPPDSSEGASETPIGTTDTSNETPIGTTDTSNETPTRTTDPSDEPSSSTVNSSSTALKFALFMF